ncbi:MAG: nuclear transport factor 2 family protein [Saprospiraceae bacterium]|nr:nuclear transport factor 2 family protein [Saprospiraceae bacterium]
MHSSVKLWFDCWREGHYKAIPVTDDFVHESPYGIISGKSNYLNIVESNKDKFLGQSFVMRDYIGDNEKACVRYQVHSVGFEMEVTEWYYFKDGLIKRIIAYYNIEGEISDARKLKNI